MNNLLLTFSILFATIPNLTIRHFPLGSPASYTASAIAADPTNPDRVWFTDQVFQQIGWINVATGEVKTYSIRPADGGTVLPAGSPQGLVFGADGNLWFPAVMNANGLGPSAIGKFDVATSAVSYLPIPSADACTFPCKITLGPDGNVWFTETVNQKLGRVTPQGAITEIPIVTDGGATTQVMKGIALGSDGNFWIPHGLRAISRVTPTGAATLFRTPATGTPFGITRGADGNVWFTQTAPGPDGNKIARITPSGVITEWAIPTANSYASAIAAGSDGKIYFVGQLSKRLGQLDPATGEIRESDIPNGRIPIGILALARRAASAGIAADAGASIRIAFNTLDPSQQDADVELAEIEEEEPKQNPCSSTLVGEISPGWEQEKYSRDFFVEPATCPCTWTAEGLPPGVDLGHSGGRTANVGGIPERAGDYHVGLKWTDSLGCSLERSYLFRVFPFRLVDATVEKSVGFHTPGIVEVGKEVEFFLHVYSTTGKEEFRFQLVDVFPGSLEPIQFEGPCSVAGQMVVCSDTRARLIRVRARVLQPGLITNCAQVYVDGDTDPTNNTGCFTLNGKAKTRAVRK